MPWGLRRFQKARCLHFVTFSCYHREARLGTPRSRDIFEQTLVESRRWYGFYVAGYVVMPEYVHLLITEPERAKLSVALQMLKQNVARKMLDENPHPVPAEKRRDKGGAPAFWQARYYDFNVWTEAKRIEKLRYIHRNPVARGLVASPEQWRWSSFRHYLSGFEAVVEIESQWTVRKRESLGITLQIQPRSQNPRPVPAKNKGAGTRTGQPPQG